MFPPPGREAIVAAGYGAANAENRRVLGKGLSRQAWALCPRTRDVDDVLPAELGLRSRYRASHPEVGLAGLDGWSPPAHGKRAAAGEAQRLAILSHHLPGAAPWSAAACERLPSSEVEPHDLLDAMALAATARAALASG